MLLESIGIRNASSVLTAIQPLAIHTFSWRMDCHTVRKIGMRCLRPSAWLVASQLKLAIAGLKPSIATIIRIASSARFATRIWKARASLPKVGAPSANPTHVKVFMDSFRIPKSCNVTFQLCLLSQSYLL